MTPQITPSLGCPVGKGGWQKRGARVPVGPFASAPGRRRHQHHFTGLAAVTGCPRAVGRFHGNPVPGTKEVLREAGETTGEGEGSMAAPLPFLVRAIRQRRHLQGFPETQGRDPGILIERQFRHVANQANRGAPDPFRVITHGTCLHVRFVGLSGVPVPMAGSLRPHPAEPEMLCAKPSPWPQRALGGKKAGGAGTFWGVESPFPHVTMAQSLRPRPGESWALPVGLILAVGLHALLFAFLPAFEPPDYTYIVHDTEVVDLPPEIEIPPAPTEIARPATPVVSTVDIDPDITIAPTSFEANRPEDLPPPVAETVTDPTDGVSFTPFTVRPEVRNRAHMARVLRREYPSALRDAGIGGQVRVLFLISEEGEVLDARIDEPSNHQSLDRAALRVAHEIEFTPALNRDQAVQVWVSIPITFRAVR